MIELLSLPCSCSALELLVFKNPFSIGYNPVHISPAGPQSQVMSRSSLAATEIWIPEKIIGDFP